MKTKIIPQNYNLSSQNTPTEKFNFEFEVGKEYLIQDCRTYISGIKNLFSFKGKFKGIEKNVMVKQLIVTFINIMFSQKYKTLISKRYFFQSLKQKIMNQFKKCKVVMLPTEKATNIFKRPTKLFHSIGLKPQTGNSINSEVIGQHLYILSDEEIKEGDWYYNTVVKVVVKSTNSINFYSKDTFKKIIATTDTELSVFIGNQLDGRTGIYNSLPRPSDSFIRKYCEKGGIDEVLVKYIVKPISNYAIESLGSQYEFIIDEPSTIPGNFYLKTEDNTVFNHYGNGYELGVDIIEVLKVDKNNTICIKSVEPQKMFNWEDVKELMRFAWNGKDIEFQKAGMFLTEGESFHQWLKNKEEEISNLI